MKAAEEHYDETFHPKKITVVSKHTAIELMESYAKEHAIEFAEFIGTEYEQDNGSVIGNVYTERSVGGKDYDIQELYTEWINQ